MSPDNFFKKGMKRAQKKLLSVSITEGGAEGAEEEEYEYGDVEARSGEEDSEIMLDVSKLRLFGFILMHAALRERILCSMLSSVFVFGCPHCLPGRLPSCLC